MHSDRHILFTQGRVSLMWATYATEIKIMAVSKLSGADGRK